MSDYVGYLVRNAKQRSKKSGLEFTITKGDLSLPDICPVLGITLHPTKRGVGRQDSAPSLDRIDSSKGYIPGNVEIISWRANELKRDSTQEERVALANYYRNR